MQSDGSSSIIVKAAQIGTITFNDGSVINLENALPGASQQKTFTIQSNSDSTVGVKYGIKLNVEKNEFQTGSIVYSMQGNITQSAESSSGSVVTEANEHSVNTGASEYFLGSGTLMPNEKHTYTLVVRFKETGSDQNSDQGKEFKGVIQVNTGDENGASMYYNSENPSGTSDMPTSQSTNDFGE